MLFRIKLKGHRQENALSLLPPVTLADIGLKEIDLQAILFDNLSRVLRHEELLPISQSRAWQEEPDIIAVDKTGKLFLFELKAWESRKENLLQVMRYAQIFSTYDYDRLSQLLQHDTTKNLAKFHQNHFELNEPLDSRQWNHQQVLIVMTNGLDHQTREAVQYWTSQGVDIRPWIYRVYQIERMYFVSFDALGAEDDPYEDVESRFHIINTNYGNNPADDQYMLTEHRAAAFHDPWKYSITNIGRNDVVFLYRNREGLVAYGKAKVPHGVRARGDDEEYYVDLQEFRRIDPPISYSEMSQIVGYKVPVLRTYTSILKEAGEALVEYLKTR